MSEAARRFETAVHDGFNDGLARNRVGGDWQKVTAAILEELLAESHSVRGRRRGWLVYDGQVREVYDAHEAHLAERGENYDFWGVTVWAEH